jgi:hypothetical protein
MASSAGTSSDPPANPDVTVNDNEVDDGFKAPINFKNAPILSDHNSYRNWRNVSKFLLSTVGCWGIMDGTLQRPATAKMLQQYFNREMQCNYYLFQTLATEHHTILTAHQNPKEILDAIDEKFGAKHTNTFYHQFKQVLDLKLADKNALSAHITNFDQQWSQFNIVCTNATADDDDKSAYHLRDFVQYDRAKANLLLMSLPLSMENVVDNLKTKQGLTYSDVYNRLMEIGLDRTVKEDMAYAVTSTTSGSASDEKTCTYCKKHYPSSKYTGHTWNICRRLKTDQEKKKKEGKGKGPEKGGDKPREEKARVIQESDSDSVVSALRASEAHLWGFDTEASSHMTSNQGLFIELQPASGKLRVADDRLIDYTGRGTINLKVTMPDGKTSSFSMKNVLYAPRLGRRNLFSWRAICNKFRMIGEDDDIIIQEKKKGTNVLHFKEENREFVLHCDVEHARLSYEEFHQALGHPSMPTVHQAAYPPDTQFPTKPANFECRNCLLAKSTHKVPKSIPVRAKNIGEILHSDLSGRFSTPSLGKHEYYMTIIDDATRYAWVYFLKKKSDAQQVMKDHVSMIERQFNVKVKVIHTDRGGEYVVIDKYFEQQGILHEYTPSYMHESNGVAERYNRTIITNVRAMLIDLPKNLWAEATNTAVYLRNRLPHKTLKGTTPYEKMFGNKPSITSLHPFGKKVYAHIPLESRPAGTKLLPRAYEGIFVGYTNSNKIFRIYNTEKRTVTERRDVKFSQFQSPKTGGPTINETEPSKTTNIELLPLPSIQDSEISSNPAAPPPEPIVESPRPQSPIEPPPPPQQRVISDPSGINPEAILPEGSRRNRRQPQAFHIQEESIEFAYRVSGEPDHYQEAINSNESTEWKKAMDEEMESIKKNNTWEVVERPEGRRIVDCKWVYKVKLLADGSIQRYKARLVAKGFTQQPGFDYDETFSPVARYESFRLLLALTAHYGWKPRQCDVKSAFLNGDLDEEIYMHLPIGYREQGMVAKLLKCLYGLKQSSRRWYAKLASSLLDKGYVPTNFDPAVFINHKTKVILSVYVDDITFFGPDTQAIEHLMDQLKIEFEITDLGLATWILGLQISYTDQGIDISQQAYINKILTKFQMNDSRPVATPLDPNITLGRLADQPTIEEHSRYQSIIGSLMYAVIGSRPDLAQTTTLLSQFSSAPKKEHYDQANRTLRYLNGTKNWILHYPRSTNLSLEGYSDSSYASCPDSRKSFSSYVFMVGNCAVSWKSKKTTNSRNCNNPRRIYGTILSQQTSYLDETRTCRNGTSHSMCTVLRQHWSRSDCQKSHHLRYLEAYRSSSPLHSRTAFERCLRTYANRHTEQSCGHRHQKFAQRTTPSTIFTDTRC